MRAEAQSHIAQIDAALSLVRRFLDWDRAVRRLDELNNRVEDPKLWDDPKAAQAVMQERRRLEGAIAAVNAIDQERADTVELMEMAEAEGDEALVDDGVRALAELAERADHDKVMALLAGEADAIIAMSRSMPAPAAPKARIGRACSSACIRAGPSATA